MNDKDRKKMIEERQATQKKAQVRAAALMVAEYTHAEDKDIKPLKAEVDALRAKMGEAQLAMRDLQGKLQEALGKLGKELEKHIAPELKA